MKKKSQTQVIEEFIETHGTVYDYKNVVYESTDAKVAIICKVHGEFWQTPYVHKRGSNCPECVIEARGRTFSKFTQDAEKVHGNKYKYGVGTGVVHSSTLLNVFCTTHMEWFNQTVFSHLQGKGCRKCGRESQAKSLSFSQEEWKEKANKVHNSLYDYSKVVYTTSKSKVIVVCPVHGEFTQLANDHIRGIGCNLCNPNGYNQKKEGLLYFLKVTTKKGEVLYKVGITNRTVKLRFSVEDLKLIQILHTETYKDGSIPYVKEKTIKDRYKRYKYVGEPVLSSGNTELFTINILKKETDAGNFTQRIDGG